MLNSLYDHGDEQPASNLTTRQLRAALADRGGALWVDVRAPSEADAGVLATALRLPPPVVTWLCQGGPPPEPAADGPLCVTLFDGDGALDIALGPNFVLTHDRGSHSYARHFGPAAGAPAADASAFPSLRGGADGFAAHLTRLTATELESAVDALSGRVAQAMADAARRPGETGAALHAVARRATALQEAIGTAQAAAQALRGAATVRDAARATLDAALAQLTEAAADVLAVTERTRSAAPGPELLALAAIARDVRRLLIVVAIGVLVLILWLVAPLLM